jgi:hypothetical protein
MDLFAVEQRNGKRWMLARHGAFACFLLACALLGASLMLSQGSSDRDPLARSSVLGR